MPRSTPFSKLSKSDILFAEAEKSSKTFFFAQLKEFHFGGFMHGCF